MTVNIFGEPVKGWKAPYLDVEYTKTKCGKCSAEVMVPKETLEVYAKDIKKGKAVVVCPKHSLTATIFH